MAEADLQSAREFYDFLVRNNQLKPDVFEQHRQLQERFGDTSAAASMTTTDAPMTDTAAEPMPELDNFMRLMSGDMPAPTEQEFEQAGTEIDQSLNRLDRMSPFRESMELGQGNPLPGARQNRRGNILTFGARDSAMRTDQPEVEVTETTESFQKADQAKKAVTEAAATTPEQMVQDEDADQTDAQATEVSLDQTNFDAEATKVGETITNPKVKTVFDDIINEVKALSIDDTEGGFYPMSKPGELMQLRDQLTTEINSYEDKIADIAQEKQKPVLEGMNKVLAILGAAIGAAGAALTRTPNEAMQMLMAFVDNEQEKFLNSKNMRVKSAENQRLDLIRRRGEIIQQLINETRRMEGVAQFNLQKATAVGSLERISEMLQQEKEQTDKSYQLAVANYYKDIFLSFQATQAKLNQGQRAKSVPPIIINDKEGNPVAFAGYQALSDKEGMKMREFHDLTNTANDLLNRLEPLLDDTSRFAPKIFSQTRSEIDQITAKLETAFKNLNGFGANYAEREIGLNTAQIPTTMDNSFSALLGTAKKSIRNFRTQLIDDYKNKMKAQGVSATQFQYDQTPQSVPGLKARN